MLRGVGRIAGGALVGGALVKSPLVQPCMGTLRPKDIGTRSETPSAQPQGPVTGYPCRGPVEVARLHGGLNTLAHVQVFGPPPRSANSSTDPDPDVPSFLEPRLGTVSWG